MGFGNEWIWVEELRPVYASTISTLPSPKSGYVVVNSMEMFSMILLVLDLTPSMSPTTSPMWQNKVNHVTPPMMQLLGSRLKMDPVMGLIRRRAQAHIRIIARNNDKSEPQQGVSSSSHSQYPSAWPEIHEPALKIATLPLPLFSQVLSMGQ
ncbi:unnamed protein product [Lactuca saligna]|uniref:Uncharacterized protein n=1 Tax=Lactuca saligna TaxID=75948 RepID=A0AA35V3S4_LACSI|nr:unnamed protein product [Lactuca saligna]CAI9261324.1 unnamed protein product [Lactuca saligna]CAI9261535.1 unnamed protein product [Lactuca saligna]